MKQVLNPPAWLSFHFHPEILKKTHRDSCPSCGSAYAGMNLYVELINESEAKAN